MPTTASKETINVKNLLIAGAIAAVFTILTNIALNWFTSNRPKITAQATIIDIRSLPLSKATVPSEREIADIRMALSEWEKANKGLFRVAQNVDFLDTLRVLSEASCALHLELKNTSDAKATNLHILMSDTTVYLLDNASKFATVDGNKITVGDLLPSETRTITVLRGFNCPTTLYAKLNNDINVSFGGGTLQPDFFSDFGAIPKFVLVHELGGMESL